MVLVKYTTNMGNGKIQCKDWRVERTNFCVLADTSYLQTFYSEHYSLLQKDGFYIKKEKDILSVWKEWTLHPSLKKNLLKKKSTSNNHTSVPCELSVAYNVESAHKLAQ